MGSIIPKRRGVTLIELVTVMAIIAIGALLVAPNIGAWIPNYRLRSAGRDVVSILRTAQVRSVSVNAEYQVSFDQGAGSYILQYRDTGGNWIDEGTTQFLPSGIRISGMTFPGNKANFYPNSTSSGGSITLENQKHFSKTVSLAGSVGRVSIN